MRDVVVLSFKAEHNWSIMPILTFAIGIYVGTVIQAWWHREGAKRYVEYRMKHKNWPLKDFNSVTISLTSPTWLYTQQTTGERLRSLPLL